MPKWQLYLCSFAITNVVLLVVVLLGKPFAAAEIWKCYAVILVMVGGGILCLTTFIEGKVGINWTLLGLAVETAFLITMYAVFYDDIGLHMADPKEVTSVSDAAYFSVITWTTVGYGDLTPTPDLRLIAATEALLGYVFSGALVGLLVNKFRS
jgi:Ion channel